jgi:hypothetical protein
LVDDDLVQQLLQEAGPASLYESEGETFYEFPRRGFSLLTDANRRINTIHFFVAPIDEYQPYSGALPRALSAQLSKEDITKRLGNPTRTGGNTISRVDGKPDPRTWIRYDYPTHSLHVQFARDGKIDLVTLMTPDALP